MALEPVAAAVMELRVGVSGVDQDVRVNDQHSVLAAAYALAGKIDEAKSAMVEARRLNPKLTVQWMIARGVNDPTRLAGYRKAGLPEE